MRVAGLFGSRLRVGPDFVELPVGLTVVVAVVGAVVVAVVVAVGAVVAVGNGAAQAVRTFKPVRYDPVERKLQTSDKNNDKKFAFIAQETVVDYRSVEVRSLFFFFRFFFLVNEGWAPWNAIHGRRSLELGQKKQTTNPIAR